MKLYLTLIATLATAGLSTPAVAQDALFEADTPSASSAVSPQAEIPGATQMLFTAVEPCRLLDTRVASPRGGRLPAQGERNFLVYDADFLAEQGGAENGCGLPASVRAVAINLTAVDADGRGFVTAWDYGTEQPATANINLIPGEDVNNQLSVAINTNPATEDLTIYSYASTHLVADIVGYYTQPQARPLECITLQSDDVMIVAGNTWFADSPQCPSDYTLTGGFCIAGTVDMRIVGTQGVSDGSHRCVAANTGTTDGTVRSEVRCCRIPGQ